MLMEDQPLQRPKGMGIGERHSFSFQKGIHYFTLTASELQDYIILLWGERGKSVFCTFSIAGKINSYINRECFSHNECSFYSTLLYNIQNCVFIREGPGREPTRFSFNLIFWVLIFVKSTMVCISKSERSCL